MLGNLNELMDDLNTLKDKEVVKKFLHEIYISTIRGGIMECMDVALIDGSLCTNWCDLHIFVCELVENKMITSNEYCELSTFINDIYLTKIDEYSRKGEKVNGKGERRCNTNSRCYTTRNGNGRTSKGETDNHKHD